MLHDENEHLMENDQQNSFLYWGPPISQEWKSLNIDQKTMGISNVPCKPSGIAIILKEPGKAGDDVTEMFPKKGGASEKLDTKLLTTRLMWLTTTNGGLVLAMKRRRIPT